MNYFNIEYVIANKIIQPMNKIVNGTLTIFLPREKLKYHIEQEHKKLSIAVESFNDEMIDKQLQAFNKFLTMIKWND